MSNSKSTTYQMAELFITHNGIIRGCNKTFEKMFGYVSRDLLRKPISILLPQLDGISLISGKEINPRLRFLMHIGHPFEVIGLGGMHMASQLFMNEIEKLGECYLRVIFCPS